VAKDLRGTFREKKLGHLKIFAANVGDRGEGGGHLKKIFRTYQKNFPDISHFFLNMKTFFRIYQKIFRIYDNFPGNEKNFPEIT
jgi:hypothetical protein